MKGQELLNILKELTEEHQISKRDLAWDEIEEASRDAIKMKLGNFKTVSLGERTEGGGDYDGAQSVFYFGDHNVFIAISGSYSSEDGCDFKYADVEVVEPVEVKTVVYRSVKNSSQAW